jgi:WhiB family transcriptional regulator, redox-sensing transcriptional regulator
VPPENVPLSRALGSTPPMDKWEAEGHVWACMNADPEAWFPDQSDVTSGKLAKAICRRCPVSDECLSWALETEQRYGIFGGMSARERRTYLRRRRRIDSWREAS